MTIQRVRALAKQRGISLSFICKKIGVAPPYFLDLEKSNREIPDDKLMLISEVLFTTIEYLKGESNNPEVQKEPTVISEDERQAELLEIYARLPDEESKDQLLRLARSFELTNKYEIEHRYIGGIAAKGGNKPIIHRIPPKKK